MSEESLRETLAIVTRNCDGLRSDLIDARQSLRLAERQIAEMRDALEKADRQAKIYFTAGQMVTKQKEDIAKELAELKAKLAEVMS